MYKLKSILVPHSTTYILLSLIVSTQAAAIVQNPKLANMTDGFLELRPNGLLILRSPPNNSSSIWQEALILKALLRVIRLMPLQTKNTLNELNEKIYGDGDEHKFPPFLERIIQRIQTYFSIYKYTDTSEPMREDLKPSSTTAAAATTTTATALETIAAPVTTSLTASATLTLEQQNEVDDNLNSGSYYGFSGQPLETSTSRGTAIEDEENVFIEKER